MNTLLFRMRAFRPGVILTIAATMIGSGLAASPARAGYVVTLRQVGSDVVATGSGVLDLTGLIGIGTDFGGPVIAPDNALIATGSRGFFDDYSGFFLISGPTSFGRGGTPAFSGTGDFVGINGVEQLLFVPQNYVSGTPLSDTAIYPFQTFATLGVTPGTYVWTWGPGADQNFTLEIKLPAPTNITQCMDGGWQTLFRNDGTQFKNQGDCIQYVNTGK